MTTTTILACLIGIAAQGGDAALELEAALGSAGLTTATARFDPNILRFYRKAEFTTPLFEALNENPWRAPWIMDVKRREIAGFAGQPHHALMAGGSWMGWSIRRTLIGDPVADLQSRSLSDVLGDMRERGLISGTVPTLDALPPEVAAAAALVLGAALRAEGFRRAAVEDMGEPGEVYRVLSSRTLFGGPAATETTLRMMRGFKPNTMAAGAHDLFLASQRAAALLERVPSDRAYRFALTTAMGEIVLNGGGPGTVTGPVLLAIDTGGDTRYRLEPSSASFERVISVVIDTHGNDTYTSGPSDIPLAAHPNRRPTDNRPGVAGALLGYSVVWDSRGNDLYRSHAPGLGSGRFGFALLYDAEGDDVFDAYTDSQGFGHFGAGILEDGGGNDLYTGFHQVQGCGLTAGLGLLVDRGGSDRYTAHRQILDFPSAQDANTNVSMAQGAGYGRRADYIDGNSLAGGVGILFDVEGDDHYDGGVFCQGVGYWEGVGALWDGGGSDVYQGVWYAMGSSAHFAVGYLEDLGGDDRYHATTNMALGAGHDFSIGILIDHTGDDTFAAPNLSLGAGNANGLGWFLDLAGNDSYRAAGLTLGAAADATPNSLRERALTLGLFMDLGGQDTYPEVAPWARTGGREVRWARRHRVAHEGHVGIFWAPREPGSPTSQR
jgi:hypothetical protein